MAIQRGLIKCVGLLCKKGDIGFASMPLLEATKGQLGKKKKKNELLKNSSSEEVLLPFSVPKEHPTRKNIWKCS